MRKSYYFISVFLLFTMLFPIHVKANIICNDGTTSPSCSDCHQGCCSHHGGCSNASSSSSRTNGGTNNTTNPIVKAELKSSDTSLKSVVIDNDEVEISDNMSYSTKKDNADINITTNDYNATVEYESNNKLDIGDNFIKIKVIAENGNVKEYKLNIIRERVLSNNKNIKILVNEKAVVFSSFKSDIIYLSNSESRIDIKYELEDKNAKAEVIGNENLKVGRNKVTVKVTAENGEEQDYTILVEKNSKVEEIIYVLITVVFFSGIGYLIYYFIKKKDK